MAIIALKCPNCAGDLELDDTREFGFCQYCGTKIMIQRETHNVTNITNNITNNVTDLNSTKSTRLKQLIRSNMDNGNFANAEDLIKDLGELDSTDPEYLMTKLEFEYKSHFEKKDLIDHLDLLSKSHTDYLKYSGSRKTLEEALDSFGMPAYDYEADLARDANEYAIANAGRGTYTRYEGELYRRMDNSGEDLGKDLFMTWADKLTNKIISDSPYSHSLVTVAIIKHGTPNNYEMIVKDRPEYAAASAIYDYAYLKTVWIVNKWGQKTTGYQKEFCIDPALFAGDEKDPSIVPETIEKYSELRSKKQFTKGLFGTKPDVKKQNEWDAETMYNVKKLKEFYQGNYDYLYKTRYDESRGKVPKWFTDYCDSKR